MKNKDAANTKKRNKETWKDSARALSFAKFKWFAFLGSPPPSMLHAISPAAEIMRNAKTAKLKTTKAAKTHLNVLGPEILQYDSVQKYGPSRAAVKQIPTSTYGTVSSGRSPGRLKIRCCVLRISWENCRSDAVDKYTVRQCSNCAWSRTPPLQRFRPRRFECDFVIDLKKFSHLKRSQLHRKSLLFFRRSTLNC